MVCIADVSGKGVPAAILMSNFQAVLRTILRKADDPIEVVHELNYQLSKNANRENFITFFMAVYDYDKRNLRYINAGHNPPLLMNGSSEIKRLTKGTTVLGAFEELPFIKMGEIESVNDFNLFLYTDGVTETFDKDEEEFGEERLEAFLVNQYGKPLEDTHQTLLQTLDDYRGEESFSDDLTFLSCRVKNGTS